MYPLLALVALMILTWAAAIAATYDDDQEESADSLDQTDDTGPRDADHEITPIYPR